MKLRIEKAIYGGQGLARIPAEDPTKLAGKTVFVPFTLPGEMVEASIAEDKRSFATGELKAVLEPSTERVVPGCEYVPRCGGCQYQHANAEFQLQMKFDILKETLARAHVAAPETIESISGPAWGYRNRIRLHVVKQNGFELGYRQGGSHKLLPVSHCPIAAPLLERAIAAMRVVGDASLCEEVEFFTNGEQDQLLVSLWGGVAKRQHALEGFAEKLREQVAELTGVGFMAGGEIRYWGERSLTYKVLGVPYQVSLGGFFQVNRFLLPALLQLAVNDRTGRLAWDLYSGAGLFARALKFDRVTAVESAGFSTDDLKQNLSGRPARVVRSSTLEFLRSQARSTARERPELILVDPPRGGLGKEICTLLGDVGAREMVYVSCDPATLGRDLQLLLPFGYAVQSMHLVDLFPQTFHMETVTALSRS